jgi:hypothetical protein
MGKQWEKFMITELAKSFRILYQELVKIGESQEFGKIGESRPCAVKRE